MCAPEHARRGRFAAAARRTRGLSIIELMVGIVVSMLIGLAAAGSAVMFTASQRQGVGTGTVSTNALGVIGAIKSDVSLAGLGFFADSTALCSTFNMSRGNTVIADGTAFAPMQVTRGTDFDTLNVLYSTDIQSGASVTLDSHSDGSAAALRSLLPVTVGQAVMLSPERGGGLCTLRSVTAVVNATETTPQSITFAAAGTHNGASFTNAPSYNTNSRASIVGEVQWNRYRVNGSGQLILERPAAAGAPTAVLLRDVIAFRVQYGVSSAVNDPTLDSWVDATGTFATVTAANIDRIRAIRVGVMVRSPQREKPDQAGNCVATTEAQTLFGTTPSAFAGDDWRCFRYRTTTAVVPLRNFVF